MKMALRGVLVAMCLASAHGLIPGGMYVSQGIQQRGSMALRSSSFRPSVGVSVTGVDGREELARARSVQGVRMAADAKSRPSVREQLNPTVAQLVDVLEATMKQELKLEPYQLPKDLERVDGEMENERCFIENYAWQSKEFRKIHIELATFCTAKGESSGLDILHCVLFPRHGEVGTSVPIFGCDLVCVRGVITAAIVDLSPVTTEKKLSDEYREAFDKHAKQFSEFSIVRDLPEFGNRIFGDRCVFVRPEGADEAQKFVKLCGAVMKLHCQLAGNSVGSKPSEGEVTAARDGQIYYCENQAKNDKTRKILEGAFGAEWTERYMSTLLFDKPE